MAAVKDNLARKQIFIPANVPEEEIVLRVAAYCRVSTDSDDQINSFTAQNSHYMEMITAHDRWELVDIYADEGITGTSAKKRKDFQRLLPRIKKPNRGERPMYFVRNRQMLWSSDAIELNKEISDILDQSHTLSLLNRQGMVDPDIFISKNNQLAEQLRKAKHHNRFPRQ